MTDYAGIRDRKLLIIATSRYGDVHWRPLPVEGEAEVWQRWLTAPTLGARRFTQVLEKLSDSPSRDYVNAALGNIDVLHSRDALVVYITGHGELDDAGNPWLVMTDSTAEKASTGIETSRVFQWLLDQKVGHAFVVVDTCHAGAAEGWLAALRRKLPRDMYVIAAASARKDAHAGRLSDAIRQFVNSGKADDSQEYLDYYALLETLANALGEQEWQHFGVLPPSHRKRLVCLPNPYYQPIQMDQAVLDPARQEMAAPLADFVTPREATDIGQGVDQAYESRWDPYQEGPFAGTSQQFADMVTYWDPRSRGVRSAGNAGTYFTGRRQVMAALLEAARGEAGTWVVTGAAGSGKSAVLSRLVTLSDSQFRRRYPQLLSTTVDPELLPADGDVDAAILATGKVAQTVLGHLCAALDVPVRPGEPTADTVTRLHQNLAGSGPRTVVIDALDEAQDPIGIVRQVLAPLALHTEAEAGWLRLLVGVRGTPDRADPNDTDLASITARALDARIIAVDRPPYWSLADLSEHVETMLTAPVGTIPSVYSDEPVTQVRRLARTIAAISGTSYVLARLLTEGLVSRGVVQDPDDQDWRSRAEAGLAQVLDDELQHDYPDEPTRTRVTTLLTASAVAYGAGVPRRLVWPAIASALDPSARPFADSDIAWLLQDRIASYLVRAVEDDTTVYRPFHDSLRAVLASTVSDVQLRAISQSLTDLAAQGAVHGITIPPHPYLRRHLPQHAAAAGQLELLLTQRPDLLAWFNPDHLAPLLDHVAQPEAQVVAGVYRRVMSALHGQDSRHRALTLQISAHRSRQPGLADTINPQHGSPWQAVWATSLATDQYTQIARHEGGGATKIAVAPLVDGTDVVVSAGLFDDTIRVTHLDGGGPAGPPAHEQVTSMATLQLQDQSWVVISGDPRGTLRVRRLPDLSIVQDISTGTDSAVTAVAGGRLYNGTDVVLATTAQSTGVWEVRTGLLAGPRLPAPDERPSSVAVGSFHDGTDVVVASWYGGLQVRDLADGSSIDSEGSHGVDTHTVTAVAADAAGNLLYAAQHALAGLTIRRLEDQVVVGRSSAHATDFHFARVGPDELAVVAWTPSQVSLVQLDGTVTHRLTNTERYALAMVQAHRLADGRAVAVSATLAGQVRVWPLEIASSPQEDDPTVPREEDPDAKAVALGQLSDGTDVVVFGGDGEAIQVRRREDGTPVRAIAAPRHGIRSLAVGSLESGVSILVGGGADATIRVWDLDTGGIIADPITGHTSTVTAIAVARTPEGPLMVSQGDDRTLRVWNISPDGTRVVPAQVLADAWGGSTRIASHLDATYIVSSWDVWRVRGHWLDRLLGRNGRVVHQRTHDDVGSACTVARLMDGTAVIVVGKDNRLVITRLLDGVPLGEPHTCPSRSKVTAVTSTRGDGAPIVIVGQRDGTVSAFHLPDGTPAAEPFTIDGGVEALESAWPSVIVAGPQGVVWVKLREVQQLTEPTP